MLGCLCGECGLVGFILKYIVGGGGRSSVLCRFVFPSIWPIAFFSFAMQLMYCVAVTWCPVLFRYSV